MHQNYKGKILNRKSKWWDYLKAKLHVATEKKYNNVNTPRLDLD